MREATFANFVSGEWVETETRVSNVNPSDLDDRIGDVHVATEELLLKTVACAQSQQPGWADCGVQRRAVVLDAAGDAVLARGEALGHMLAREEGKTAAEGMGEVARAGQILKFFAGEAVRNAGMAIDSVRPGVDVLVSREPVGVVAAVTPWNFPIAIPAWKVAPALAYGNAVVLKCSELTAASACALVEILHDSGVPPGVVGLLQGDANIGGMLVDAEGIDAVSFTGSVRVGNTIALSCAAGGVRFQLEMGGKNPLLILDDADLDVAVRCALDGAFFSAGQRCTASSRLIVQKGICQRFVSELASRLAAVNVGHALSPSTQIGPLASAAQLHRVLCYIEHGRKEAGEPVVGGHLLERTPRGYFVAPTLFADTANTMRINREEIFGPVATVIPVATFEEGLAVANDTEFGLSAGICTRSLRYSREFQRRAEAGLVMVNLPTAGVDYHVPFGGAKASSAGPREQGAQAREFYTQMKTSYVAS